MDLDEKKNAKEANLFYGMFTIWRKLAFALSLVFFDKNFKLQAGTQLVCSGVMGGYMVKHMPHARYSDNVSKVANEFVFASNIVQASYIKEMGSKVGEFDPKKTNTQAKSQIGGSMIAMTTGLLVFHAARTGSNSVRAVGTLKARRQSITAKWLGPPTINDPNYSNDESSGGEDGPPGLPDLKPDHDDMGPPDPKQRHKMYEHMIKPWNNFDADENEAPKNVVYLGFDFPKIVEVNLKVIEEKVFELRQAMPERDDLS